MNNKKNIVILGGGQVAAYAVKEIRKIDNFSELTIISEEECLPYERPPLSKDCLLGKMSFEKCLFFNKNFYEENKINFIKDTKITSADFKNQKIFSSKGESYNFDKLLIATGSKNKNLIIGKKEMIPDENLIYLRNIKDSLKLKNKINLAKDIIIIGGGFIGLEIASAASQLGKKVIILERGEQLMGRVIPSEVAKLIHHRHQKEGTKIHLGVDIKSINKLNINSYEISLNTGKKLLTDLLIVGIGSTPDISIYKNSNL